MQQPTESIERTPIPMQRLSLEFACPGMVLARDVYDQDGTAMIAADTILSERLIEHLRQRDICSIFVRNPRIDLPEIPDAVREKTRMQARLMVEHAFDVIRRAEKFSLSDNEQQTVHQVVEEVSQDSRTTLPLAYINRHARDLLAHSVNVSLLSAVTALALGIKKDTPELYDLALAAMLHDIGKIMIPQDLLSRTDRLSPEEAAIYREHTNWGRVILQQTLALPPVAARVAQEHHEHTDGSGFPQQLTGSMLHLFSRIVAVVNAYENLCAATAPRNCNQSYLAYESIMAEAGCQFDLNSVKALLSRLPMYPHGILVELTNGFIGIVAFSNPALPHRPLIKVLANPDGSMLDIPFPLDLSDLDNQTIFVKEILNDARAAQFIAADIPG